MLTLVLTGAQPQQETTWAVARDPISSDIIRLRGVEREPGARVRVGRRGTPVWNLVRNGESAWQLVGKTDGKVWKVRQTPPDRDHRMKGHERLSCSACHARWTPTCTTCHTSYDPKGKQWDFAAGAVTPGDWRETNDGMAYGPPTLGVDSQDRIIPATPGMIFTLSATAAGGPLLHRRLFAPIHPHTTGKKARGCPTCHGSPTALGFGEGELKLDSSGPRFTPTRPDPNHAGRGTDGWVGLFDERPGRGTRRKARSLDAAEQRRVLRVGACLSCHPRSSDAIYADFRRALNKLDEPSSACPTKTSAWMRSEPRRPH